MNKKICKNCLLYNKQDGMCDINVILEGEYFQIAVKPEDECHWEKVEKELDIPIRQIRVWHDGKKGFIES